MIERVRYLTTGEVFPVVRGPFRKFGDTWYDVIRPNQFGEPGQYSSRIPARNCEPVHTTQVDPAPDDV